MPDDATIDLRQARPGDADAARALLDEVDVEVAFEADEFLVAEGPDGLLGCVRLKPLPRGGQELASLAVAPDARGRGLGSRLVEAALDRAGGPVHALALAPDLLEDHGFVPADEVHPDLAEKQAGCCADRGAVPMVSHPDGEAWAEVRDRYGALAAGADDPAETDAPVEADEAGSCCAPASPYPEEVLEAVPDEAERGLGTGDPVGAADLVPGETVVDLGSGAGVDVLRAAEEVGPRGQVVGVDITPEMVETARRIAHENGYDQVEFLNAPMESIPLEDGLADAVVSNCVLNLAPDKVAALREARRLLRPGGQLVVSDTLRVAPAEDDACGVDCGCVGGAWTEEEWRDGLEEAGFQEVAVDVEPPTGRFGPDVGTATIRARKPS